LLQYCRAMLKIRRCEDEGFATYAVSGRIEEQYVAKLQELLDAETEDAEITLDLEELRLVDRQSVKFLADCEARGIKLKNCPSYIRQWIGTGSGTCYEPY